MKRVWCSGRLSPVFLIKASGAKWRDPALEILNKHFVLSVATGHLQLKSKHFINAHIVRSVSRGSTDQNNYQAALWMTAVECVWNDISSGPDQSEER